MFERRQHFLAEYDWIRTGLMFEPRGHDMMSGSILYPPTRPDCDVGILFIETSGCLPMCGHGTIGTVTIALENGLIQPEDAGPAAARHAGRRGRGALRAERPVHRAACASPTSRPSSTARATRSRSRGSGTLTVDVAYGGNFYAIVEPQALYSDLADVNPSDILRWSPKLRDAFNARYAIAHPENPAIDRLTHVLWTGRPQNAGRHGAQRGVLRRQGHRPLALRHRHLRPHGASRRARTAEARATHSCTRASSARPSSAASKGRAKVGDRDAIIPSIEGWARVTGLQHDRHRRPGSVRPRLPGRRPRAASA